MVQFDTIPKHWLPYYLMDNRATRTHKRNHKKDGDDMGSVSAQPSSRKSTKTTTPGRGPVIFLRLETDSPENTIVRDMLLSRSLSFSGAARECMLEYALLLRDALRELDFTDDEASVLVLAMKEAVRDITRTTYHLMGALVESYLKINPMKVRKDFVERLRAYNFLYTAAIIDGIRRYWGCTQSGQPMIPVLKEVGLLKETSS